MNWLIYRKGVQIPVIFAFGFDTLGLYIELNIDSYLFFAMLCFLNELFQRERNRIHDFFLIISEQVLHISSNPVSMFLPLPGFVLRINSQTSYFVEGNFGLCFDFGIRRQ